MVPTERPDAGSVSAGEIGGLFTRFIHAADRGDKVAALEILRAGYDLFNNKNVDVWLELLDPDVEWHSAEQAPELGVHHGHDGVKRFFESQFEVWQELRVEAEDFFRQGDEVVVFARQRGRGSASGVEVDVRVAHVWTLRSARVVRFRIFPRRADALKAVGLEA